MTVSTIFTREISIEITYSIDRVVLFCLDQVVLEQSSIQSANNIFAVFGLDQVTVVDLTVARKAHQFLERRQGYITDNLE